jgi:hypothetical protein
MLSRLRIRTHALALLALVVGSATPATKAAPISYVFRGSLDQPYNGSKDFSGTFSYETATPGFSTGTLISGAAGASASVSIGGQSYAFQGSPASGISGSVMNSVPVSYRFSNNHGGTGDSFSLYATGGVSASAPFTQGAAMTINLSDPTGKAYPPVSQNMPPLVLGDFATRIFSFSPTPTAPARLGTIMSLAPAADPFAAPIPEPSTLAFLALVGIGLAARRRFGRA